LFIFDFSLSFSLSSSIPHTHTLSLYFYIKYLIKRIFLCYRYRNAIFDEEQFSILIHHLLTLMEKTYLNCCGLSQCDLQTKIRHLSLIFDMNLIRFNKFLARIFQVILNGLTVFSLKYVLMFFFLSYIHIFNLLIYNDMLLHHT
jgi:hypothetical protein